MLEIVKREAIRISDVGALIRAEARSRGRRSPQRGRLHVRLSRRLALGAHAGQHRLDGEDKGRARVARWKHSGDSSGSYFLLGRGPVTGSGARLSRRRAVAPGSLAGPYNMLSGLVM